MSGPLGGHISREQERTASRACDDSPSHGLRPAQGWVTSLHRRAGNQAVTRLLHADDPAPTMAAPQATSVRDPAQAASAPPVVTAAVRRPGTPLEPSIRQEFEHRLGRDLSTVRIHAGGEATRAAAAAGAGAYTLGRHIVISEGLDDPLTPEGRHLLGHELTHVVQQAAFSDHQLADAPVLGRDHPGEQQARAGTGAVTPLAAPAVQRGPLDIVTSQQHITIDLSAKKWRQSAAFKGGQSQVVYVLKDSATGEMLKVGKTTVNSLEGRFGEYVSAGNKWGRKLAVDVYTMRKRPGRTVQVFEKEMRAGLEKMGYRLPWDNTDGRLGRAGKGILEPKPLSESNADLELIDAVEEKLHAAPPASTVAPAAENSAESTAAPALEHGAESTVTPAAEHGAGRAIAPTLERGAGRGTSALGKMARLGPALVEDVVVGYLTNKIAMNIMHGGKFEQERDVLNQANHVPTVPTKEEESADTLLSYIPPGFDIAAAITTRLIGDVMYGMVTEDAARRAEKFRQDYPDAPPGAYEELEKRADDLYNGLVDY